MSTTIQLEPQHTREFILAARKANESYPPSSSNNNLAQNNHMYDPIKPVERSMPPPPPVPAWDSVKKSDDRERKAFLSKRFLTWRLEVLFEAGNEAEKERVIAILREGDLVGKDPPEEDIDIDLDLNTMDKATLRKLQDYLQTPRFD